MEDLPFLSWWDHHIRIVPQLERLRQPGIGRSYPLFADENGRLQVRFFYHPAVQMGPNNMHIGAPGVCVLMDYEDGSLLALLPPEELGIAPFEAVSHLVPPERKETIRLALEHLKKLYDQVAGCYPEQPAGELGPAFWGALSTVVPQALLPAYEKLSPDFMAWLYE